MGVPNVKKEFTHYPKCLKCNKVAKLEFINNSIDLKVPIPNMIKVEDRQIALCCDDTTIRVLNINYNYSIDE